jgi:hypothetical protein
MSTNALTGSTGSMPTRQMRPCSRASPRPAIAEKVAKYRRAQLSAVRLAGDINATVTDNASLDELLAKIKDELRKLGPLIDLEAIRESHGSRTQGGSTVIEHGWRSGA